MTVTLLDLLPRVEMPGCERFASSAELQLKASGACSSHSACAAGCARCGCNVAAHVIWLSAEHSHALLPVLHMATPRTEKASQAKAESPSAQKPASKCSERKSKSSLRALPNCKRQKMPVAAKPVPVVSPEAALNDKAPKKKKPYLSFLVSIL